MMKNNILKNQVNQDTTWFGNAWLSKTNKSAGELYSEYHFNNKGKNIAKGDLINLNFSDLTPFNGSSSINREKTGGFFKSKAGKITMGIAGAAALIGIGYKFLMKKPADAKAISELAPAPAPVIAEEIETKEIATVENTEILAEEKHLSAVV